ncbi:MAG: molybdopterin converting factor subunit 1 [Pseudomonadota bacterium]|jgi:MoaE-MoaD fusion protein
MRVRVLFFASLRERVGDREVVRTVEDGATAADLVARLRADFPALDEAGRFAIAVNSEYTDGGHRLADGDEVALIPPVSGGRGSDRELRRDVPAATAGAGTSGLRTRAARTR